MPTILACSALTLEVQADAGISARFLSDLTEGWQAATGPAAAVVTLQRSQPPAMPATGAPFAYGDLAGRAGDEGLWLRSRTSGLWVDYGQRTAMITLTPDAEPDLAFCRDTLWRLAVIELGRTLGRFYLHAAAIAVGEAVWLICAEGGTGKSTLAAAARMAGYPVLTDDAAILHAGGELRVSALPAAWRLSGPAAGWLGLDPGPAKQRLFLPGPVAPLPVAAVCLTVRGDHSACLPIAPAAALPELIRQNPLIMTSRHLATSHLAALTRLVDTTACKRLVLGSDLLLAPEIVRHVLPV